MRGAQTWTGCFAGVAACEWRARACKPRRIVQYGNCDRNLHSPRPLPARCACSDAISRVTAGCC